MIENVWREWDAAFADPPPSGLPRWQRSRLRREDLQLIADGQAHMSFLNDEGLPMTVIFEVGTPTALRRRIRFSARTSDGEPLLWRDPISLETRPLATAAEWLEWVMSQDIRGRISAQADFTLPGVPLEESLQAQETRMIQWTSTEWLGNFSTEQEVRVWFARATRKWMGPPVELVRLGHVRGARARLCSRGAAVGMAELHDWAGYWRAGPSWRYYAGLQGYCPDSWMQVRFDGFELHEPTYVDAVRRADVPAPEGGFDEGLDGWWMISHPGSDLSLVFDPTRVDVEVVVGHSGGSVRIWLLPRTDRAHAERANWERHQREWWFWNQPNEYLSDDEIAAGVERAEGLLEELIAQQGNRERR